MESMRASLEGAFLRPFLRRGYFWRKSVLRIGLDWIS
jgi:hypothetical protein